ncbi:hypothetical protein KR059_001197 [Drosophila kikkawai]|nr:uncharacterized protein LOC108086160 [Drosophila kikkawai]KAH8340557.1 hypothetical protein KR059_001197 [Drosophila kikkawai]
MDAYMTAIECPNYLPELVTNLSCHLDRSSQSNGTFSVNLTLAKDVKDIKGTYIFSIKRGSTINNYTAIEMDYCQALSSLQSNFLLKMIADELRRSANFPLQCPFKMKKLYYINRYTINPKMIPSYAPELNFKSDCLISLNKRKALRLIIHGRVVRRRSSR